MRFVYQPTNRLTLDLTTDYQWTRQNAFPYGLYDDANTVADPSTTQMNGYKRQMVNTGLNIGYKADNWLLSSTTSWQYLRDHMEMDQDYLPDDFMHLSQLQKQQALTQELILRSHGQRKWHWTFGVFGSYQWLRTDAPVTFGPAMNAMTAARIMSMMPAYVQSMFTIWEIPDFHVTETFHTPSASVGAFHESTISLTNRLDVTLGLRYEFSRMKIDYDTEGLVALHYAIPPLEKTSMLTAVLQSGSKRSFDQLLPKVGVTYRLDDSGSNIYATVSKGYRAGGYNIQMFSEIYQSEFMNKGKSLSQGDVTINYTDEDYEAVDETISYKPEESWNYEAGAHLNLLDGKLHADVAVYYMKIRNQQLSMMTPDNNFGRIMVNAGKSHTMGVELSLRGRAFDDRLDWFFNLGAVNAKFDEYDTYNGNSIPFVPSTNFALGGSYRMNRFFVGADLTGQGYTEWNEANSFGQKAYVLLGAHVGYDFGNCNVKLWGRNLTDTKYNTFAVESKAAGQALRFAQRGNPIQLGMDVNIHF
jgi:outer membrane receptor protein involved in Fe transport